jgi:hypothetical protein
MIDTIYREARQLGREDVIPCTDQATFLDKEDRTCKKSDDGRHFCGQLTVAFLDSLGNKPFPLCAEHAAQMERQHDSCSCQVRYLIP